MNQRDIPPPLRELIVLPAVGKMSPMNTPDPALTALRIERATKGTVRVLGYGRGSDASKQEDSTQRQAEKIDRRAVDLVQELEAKAKRGGKQKPTIEYVGCVQEEGSATTMRFHERPKLAELLSKLQDGDYLIIWRLDRLDRNGAGLLRAVEQITGSQGVHLYVLDYGGNEIEMDSMVGMVVCHAMALVAAVDGKQRSEAVKAGMKRARERGEGASGSGNLGFRTIIAKGQNGRGIIVGLEPCEEERQQIREVHRRRGRGESWQSIARNFHRRGLMTPQGRPWVRIRTQKQPTKAGIKEYPIYGMDRIKRVWKRYDVEGEEMFVLGLRSAREPGAKLESIPLDQYGEA